MAIGFTACNQGKIDELSQENKSLVGENLKMDSTINDFIQTLNEVEENLALIREKEELINHRTGEGVESTQDAKDEIINDIQSINTLLDENRRKMDALRVDLKKSNLKIKEFDRMVRRLNKEVKGKDGEIAEMKEALTKLNFENEALNMKVTTLTNQVDTLESVNIVQTALIGEQQQEITTRTNKMNTAYYITGSSKELAADQIVERNGGILGLGSTEKLASNVANDKFNKIDITETMMIPVDGRKADMVTAHPEGSYKIVFDEDSKAVAGIEIIDPEGFWKASKYLVVVTN